MSKYIRELKANVILIMADDIGLNVLGLTDQIHI